MIQKIFTFGVYGPVNAIGGGAWPRLDTDDRYESPPSVPLDLITVGAGTVTVCSQPGGQTDFYSRPGDVRVTDVNVTYQTIGSIAGINALGTDVNKFSLDLNWFTTTAGWPSMYIAQGSGNAPRQGRFYMRLPGGNGGVPSFDVHFSRGRLRPRFWNNLNYCSVLNPEALRAVPEAGVDLNVETKLRWVNASYGEYQLTSLNFMSSISTLTNSVDQIS